MLRQQGGVCPCTQPALEGGRVLRLQVAANQSVGALKRLICDRTRVVAARQRLWLGAVELSDDHLTLAEYSLHRPPAVAAAGGVGAHSAAAAAAAAAGAAGVVVVWGERVAAPHEPMPGIGVSSGVVEDDTAPTATA
jgi:hypothetical protein